ncbi:MAG TPA: class I SAM-dependent methyltransferase [Thermoanaerobaculia bacterium]|nr:class I SAM-dependent methyltransferase [Thermoanaerobaculia bacterium]
MALLNTIATRPLQSARLTARVPDAVRAAEFSRHWPQSAEAPAASADAQDLNPLRVYFEGHDQGRGIWKWLHYFDVYHRHLEKFVGSDARLVEIGVYSGGSLEMWRDYLGSRANIVGVDIAPECKVYENEWTAIEIGDQADRQFWSGFRERHSRIDVVIDDGGHQPEQQMTTLEELLPYLAPGGVYICEDVQGQGSHFAAFTHALADHLNASHSSSVAGVPRTAVTPLQAAVHSITYYPFMVVIERNSWSPAEFIAPKHGTEWQPFFK